MRKPLLGVRFLVHIPPPIQIIPNFIPVVEELDDVLVITLGIKYLQRHVPQSVLDECGDCKSPIARKPKIRVTPVTDPLPSSEL